MDNLDRDPARVQYKRQLQSHLASSKKLSEAKDDFQRVCKLSNQEQQKFFAKQLDHLVSGLGQVRDIDSMASSVLKQIYKSSITEAKDAILYMMETIYRKHLISKNQTSLLLSMHESIRFNLKVVLSLSAGTKERLDRIDSAIQNPCEAQEGFIHIGEADKARMYIQSLYKSHPYNDLYIIDPYFGPADLVILKSLFDINNNLKIGILAHKKDSTCDDYQNRWNHISAELTGAIQIVFVNYTDIPDDGPLHDRFWLICDFDSDSYFGFKTNSISGMGNKESSIEELSSSSIHSVLNIYNKYANIRTPKVGGRVLLYKLMEMGKKE